LLRFFSGILIPVRVKTTGLGGALSVAFACNGCQLRQVSFDSTTYVESSRRSVVSLALHVAMFVGGVHHSQIVRTLGQGLGLHVLSRKNFFSIIKLLYPVTKVMLEEMCNKAKDTMRRKPDNEQGSFQRAITTADGCWLTRGHFSKNFTLHVKDFLTQALLYYVHLCQRGRDDICEDELYPGTSKSCEGYAASRIFQQAANEGMNIEVNWQDGDSSSEAGFRAAFPDKEKCKVMLCGGHVTRAHGKQLEKLAAMKQVAQGYVTKHKSDFPTLATVKCCCAGKKHSKGCGCMSDNFQRTARINHALALLEADATKDPKTYAEIMLQLGQHHCRNIHIWEGGHCSFHATKSCTCGKCDPDNPTCSGKPYTSKYVLSCPMHQLLYQVETAKRAKNASSVIHPDFGRGHSNLPESDHSVFVRFRAKDLNIERLHYVVSTNLALMQSNMAWLSEVHGPSYHWIPDLYTRVGLPVVDDIVDACKRAVCDAEKNRLYKTRDETKKLRIRRKQARVEENEERKRWVRQQLVQHTYGDAEEYGDQADDDEAEAAGIMVKENQGTSAEVVVVGTVAGATQCCKCGSSKHKRTSHKDCPLKKKKTSEHQ